MKKKQALQSFLVSADSTPNRQGSNQSYPRKETMASQETHSLFSEDSFHLENENESNGIHVGQEAEGGFQLDESESTPGESEHHLPAPPQDISMQKLIAKNEFKEAAMKKSLSRKQQADATSQENHDRLPILLPKNENPDREKESAASTAGTLHHDSKLFTATHVSGEDGDLDVIWKQRLNDQKFHYESQIEALKYENSLLEPKARRQEQDSAKLEAQLAENSKLKTKLEISIAEMDSAKREVDSLNIMLAKQDTLRLTFDLEPFTEIKKDIQEKLQFQRTFEDLQRQLLETIQKYVTKTQKYEALIQQLGRSRISPALEDGDDVWSNPLSPLDPALLAPVPEGKLPTRSNVFESFVHELESVTESLSREKRKNKELTKINAENGKEIAQLQKDLEQRDSLLKSKHFQISTSARTYESMHHLKETSHLSALASRGGEEVEEIQAKYQVLIEEKASLRTKCHELERELEELKRQQNFAQYLEPSPPEGPMEDSLEDQFQEVGGDRSFGNTSQAFISMDQSRTPLEDQTVDLEIERLRHDVEDLQTQLNLKEKKVQELKESKETLEIQKKDFKQERDRFEKDLLRLQEEAQTLKNRISERDGQLSRQQSLLNQNEGLIFEQQRLLAAFEDETEKLAELLGLDVEHHPVATSTPSKFFTETPEQTPRYPPNVFYTPHQNMLSLPSTPSSDLQQRTPYHDPLPLATPGKSILKKEPSRGKGLQVNLQMDESMDRSDNLRESQELREDLEAKSYEQDRLREELDRLRMDYARLQKIVEQRGAENGGEAFNYNEEYNEEYENSDGGELGEREDTMDWGEGSQENLTPMEANFQSLQDIQDLQELMVDDDDEQEVY